jgi:benzil reductase ((S)-benzoin forming)
MRYYVITGTSSGLGEALADSCIGPGNQIHSISRRPNERLERKAAKAESPFHYHRFDLASTDRIAGLTADILSRIEVGRAEYFCLINNAGVVDPVAPADRYNPDDMEWAMRVNLIAPMMLTSYILHTVQEWECRRVVVNISSGAAKHPYDGWSAYCTAKAGLDMFTRSVALEQDHRRNPVRIVAVAPGVVDTPMQSVVRSSKERDFRHRQKFIRLKEEGALLSPAESARRVLRVIDAERFENGAVVDIRDSG